MSGAPLEIEFALTCNVAGCGDRAHYYSSVKRVNQGSDELHEVFTLFGCEKHTFIVQRGPIVTVPPKPWKLKSLDVEWDATVGMRCVEDGCKHRAREGRMHCYMHGGEASV